MADRVLNALHRNLEQAEREGEEERAALIRARIATFAPDPEPEPEAPAPKKRGRPKKTAAAPEAVPEPEREPEPEPTWTWSDPATEPTPDEESF